MEELLATHRKERKETIALTQKMKHNVSKGDKKKKKEVNAEVTRILAELDLKHEKEISDFKVQHITDESRKDSDNSPESHETADGISSRIQDFHISRNEEVSEHDLSAQNRCGQENNESSSEHIVKLSKAQKRRNKKALLQKEREKAIEEQEILNLSSEKHIESQKMQEKLAKRCLMIHEIPSDGNCLYKAVEHQLSLASIQTDVKSLREQTSRYLLSHMDEYLPFVTCPESGDVLSEEKYIKYCEDIAQTSAWGGHVEIQVLSHILVRSIEIIQADSPSIIVGEEYSNPKLVLSYHKHVYGLGEHYNSVIPVTE